MAYQTRQILIGAAALFVSTLDSTSGAYVSTAFNPFTGVSTSESVLDATNAALSGDNAANWRHTGFTSEGMELSYEPDFGDVEVDQLLDSAKIYKQSQRVMLNTSFAEASLENLLVVWAQQSTTLTSNATSISLGIAAGSLGDEPTERNLLAVGLAPRTPSGTARERVYWARRVISVESSSQSLSRNDPTVFPVSFRLLPDPTFVGSEYGVVVDRNKA